jgi:hypothetical protein
MSFRAADFFPLPAQKRPHNGWMAMRRKNNFSQFLRLMGGFAVKWN